MRVEIGFGVGFTKDGKIIPHVDEAVSSILRVASHEFGGAALIPVQGAWRNGAGVVVREGGHILRIDNVPVAGLDRAKWFASEIKATLNQESVVYSVSDVHAEFL